MAQDDEPEVIFLDIGLPLLDGYEVARRLRRIAALRGARLVAMTGYGQCADQERARAAGFDHHLVKPVHFASIQPILAESGKQPAGEI
jgi:CheY-like chemotaxis protein